MLEPSALVKYHFAWLQVDLSKVASIIIAHDFEWPATVFVYRLPNL